MTIQQFIEKAIEGGWLLNGSPRFFEVKSLVGNEVEFFCVSNRQPNVRWSTFQILLDPLAWQAVGKVEGWDERTQSTNKEGWEIRNARWYMHRMVDFLAEGKSVEEFIATL